MAHSSSDHFEGKNPHEHVLKKKSEVATEIHGDEIPGHLGSFLDALRDTSILFLILWTIIHVMDLPLGSLFHLFLFISVSWVIWKGVRSFWVASARLERLHRVLKEERYEIENHRPQEREELKALYAAKGFKGPLLDEVLDVLMADDERLLRVMMEEEMGLSLGNYEHPLKIGLSAALGVLVSSFILFAMGAFTQYWSFVSVACLLIALSGYSMAKLQKNDGIAAFIWNLGFAILTFGVLYFLSHWILLTP